jgi:hypothetical protein
VHAAVRCHLNRGAGAAVVGHQRDGATPTPIAPPHRRSRPGEVARTKRKNSARKEIGGLQEPARVGVPRGDDATDRRCWMEASGRQPWRSRRHTIAQLLDHAGPGQLLSAHCFDLHRPGCLEGSGMKCPRCQQDHPVPDAQFCPRWGAPVNCAEESGPPAASYREVEGGVETMARHVDRDWSHRRRHGWSARAMR